MPLAADLSAAGSLTRAVFDAGGAALDAMVLEQVFKPRVGDVYALPAEGLPVEHILFVVMPRWRNEFDRQERDVTRACRGALRTAQEMGLKRIAFPALGTGHSHKGLPPQRAARLITQAISDRLLGQLDEVRIVCNRAETHEAFTGLLS